MRAVHGATVLYLSDATSTVALTCAVADISGVSYMRTTRGGYPVLYGPDESFPVGGSNVPRSSEDDQMTLIGAGVTLHQCPAAADQLAEDGIRARVIDLYSVKRVDTDTLVAAARATQGLFVVAEDHHPEGGLGSAVAETLLTAEVPRLRLSHLAVRTMPGSGTTAELLDGPGISARHIEAAAKELLAKE